ncbi:MAG: glycosyltransferase family 9 protein [Bacteroidota bacterium]
MSSKQHKKALVFFSAGVGDAILLVPLVNELKKQGYTVTGLFTSVFGCESIFKNTALFDSIVVKKRKPALFSYAILNSKKYDLVFLNHFSYSQSNIYCANLLGKSVYTNYNHAFSLRSLQSVHVTEPIANTHDALQNVFLFNLKATLIDLNFDLHYKPQNKNTFQLPKKYITIQVSSANNNAPYKNWEFEKWLELFKHLKNTMPDTSLVLLGDHTELYLNEKIDQNEYPNIISLIGKTTLNEAMEIIYHSQFYIGLDSGLMHMAVALGKPTFTIWGASNSILYGYEWLGQKHKIVSMKLACAPCSAWMNPNISRVKDPLKCPDFKCIREITVSKVIDELDAFIKTI